MQFSEVIGHEAEKAHLRDLVQNNRLSHSLLFLGKEGSGALPMAIAFAQYILCERVQNKNKEPETPSLFGEVKEEEENHILRSDSCGICDACKKAGKLLHPDLHFSYPALKKNARHAKVLSTDYINEWRSFVDQHLYGNAADWLSYLGKSPTAEVENPTNKQGNITVYECEDILNKLSLKPFESDFKIMIMWMPEYLGKEGNRLLKLIEEPPAGTIFIFVAEDETTILPTILSRTQLVKIPLAEDEEVLQSLMKKGIDTDRAAQITALAGGNLREAFALIDNHGQDWLEAIRAWMNIAYSNHAEKLSQWIDEVDGLGRGNQKQLLQYLLHLIEQSMRIAFLGEENARVINEEEKDFIIALNRMCDMEILEEMTHEIEKNIYYIERNANTKLLFHALTIRFFHLIRDKKLILVH